MRFRLSVPFSLLVVFATLLFAAGCDRTDTTTYIAEVNEPGYIRGKELLKQGRNPEALSEFDKVLAKRGLNNAPETNLELGILYQQHIHDPLSAIFHFQKYLEQKPNAERSVLVKQRIEVAKREYASTLPGRPSLDMQSGGANADYIEVINRLRTDNDRLKAALSQALAASGMNTPATAAGPGTTARSAANNPISPVSATTPGTNPQPVAISSALTTQVSQIQNPAGGNTVAQQAQIHSRSAPQQQPALQPQMQQPQQAQPQPPTATSSRRYVVKAKDSLSSIARQFYGSATNAQIDGIVSANRDLLQSRSTPLRVGMELKIP